MPLLLESVVETGESPEGMLFLERLRVQKLRVQMLVSAMNHNLRYGPTKRKGRNNLRPKVSYSDSVCKLTPRAFARFGPIIDVRDRLSQSKGRGFQLKPL